MKLFLVLSSVLAAALARPGAVIAPVAYSVFPAAPAAVVAPVSSQYHAQDELGQYSYGYASGLSAKAETKTFDGVTRGGYSFVDATGKLQSVEYVSDAVNGFRVAASNLPVAPAAPAVALPVPVVDTAEVAEAKAKHLAALEAATSSEAPSTAPPPPASSEAPAPSEAPAAEPASEAESAAPEAPATPAAVSVAAPKAVAAAPLFAPAAVPYAFAVPGAVTSFTSYSAPVAAYTYTAGAFPAVAAYALPAAGAPEATTKLAEEKAE